VLTSNSLSTEEQRAKRATKNKKNIKKKEPKKKEQIKKKNK
jgi:hypothetical protein